LEHIHSQSAERIAADLGISEKNVRKFLKEINRAPSRKENLPAARAIHPAKKNEWILPIIIILAGVLAYSNSFNGGFLLDDDFLVGNNAFVKSWANLPKVFTQDIMSAGGQPSNFYRPIQTITYMLDHSLWADRVQGYHLSNLFFHILVALVFYGLCRLLFKDVLLAFAAAALYVVHPIHTEAVCYISGRADSLVTLFMLLALIFYVRSRSSPADPKPAVLSLLFYSFALLSKEYALILPAIVVLYHFVFKKPWKSAPLFLMLVMTVLYGFLRSTVLQFPSFVTPEPSRLADRLPGVFVAMARYLKLLIFPHPLRMEYVDGPFSFSDPRAILGFILAAALIFYGWNRWKANDHLSFFSITWFFVTLFPNSNLYPLNAFMAEHWLYVPSMGLFVAAAMPAVRAYRSGKGRRWITAGFLAALALFSFLTIRQSEYWKDALTFYEKTLVYSPHSVRVYYNLGNYYSAKKDFERSFIYYQKAIEGNPRLVAPHYNLGMSFFAAGKYAEAIGAFQEVVALEPGSADARYNLGLAYIQLGRYKEAASEFEHLIKAQPDDPEILFQLGGLCSIGKGP
jgi:hypothetical protein